MLQFKKAPKTAVVLFNLGGPDKLSSVRNFLFNLFNDKAIINLPQPLRFLLAKLISSRRDLKAQEIYKQIGGKSPLLDITISQADSLQRELSFYGDFKVFVAMRYWHPFALETSAKVKEYKPDSLILLPLYPQFSSTTSASSINDFLENYQPKNEKVKIICCYPESPEFIKSHGLLLKQTLEKIPLNQQEKVRILFSAHGLPMSVINRGDPYVFQVQLTATKIISCLRDLQKHSNFKIDSQVCFQSKVGPLKWTSPSLEQELRRAAHDKKIPVILPIAFTSDHSETLVELDLEYKELAHSLGIEEYHRVPALNINGHFIKSLAEICLNSLNDKISEPVQSNLSLGLRVCPKNFRLCPNSRFDKCTNS